MGDRGIFGRRALLRGAGAGAGVAALGVLGRPNSAGADESGPDPDVVRVWFVDAVGAPFQPHLFTYHADQTMISANPDAGDSHTSDSDGMGPWAMEGKNRVIGAFEYVSRLRVEYTITLHGDTFTGPAVANYYNPDGTLQQGPFPATLNGRRVPLR